MKRLNEKNIKWIYILAIIINCSLYLACILIIFLDSTPWIKTVAALLFCLFFCFNVGYYYQKKYETNDPGNDEWMEQYGDTGRIDVIPKITNIDYIAHKNHPDLRYIDVDIQFFRRYNGLIQLEFLCSNGRYIYYLDDLIIMQAGKPFTFEPTFL